MKVYSRRKELKALALKRRKMYLSVRSLSQEEESEPAGLRAAHDLRAAAVQRLCDCVAPLPAMVSDNGPPSSIRGPVESIRSSELSPCSVARTRGS